MPAILKLNNLCFHYKLFSNKKLVIFENLNLEVSEGSKIGIIGPSGIGKTTLFKLIKGEIKPIDGEIIIDKKVGMLIQEPILNEWLTCEEILELQIEKYHSNFTPEELLQKINLISKKDLLLGSLSGGEQQRIALTLQIISGAELILADEPLAKLDYTTAIDILNTLFDIIEGIGLTIIISTHNRRYLNYLTEIFEIREKNLIKIERDFKIEQ